VLFNTINGNTHNFGAAFFPFVSKLRNSTEFGGTNRGKIFGVREKNGPLIANPIVQRKSALIGFNRSDSG
jgi:hypothetical protein